MRRVPRLNFIADFSIVEGDRVRALMRSIAPSDGVPDDAPDGAAEDGADG
jgi:hypothetical protein